MAFQGIVAVGRYIKHLLTRIIALEEHLNSRPGDMAEQRRREELIRYAVSLSLRSCPDFLDDSELEDVEGKLRSFSDTLGFQQPHDCTQNHEVVLGLLEDLQEAIFHYQVCPSPTVFSVLTRITGCTTNSN